MRDKVGKQKVFLAILCGFIWSSEGKLVRDLTGLYRGENYKAGHTHDHHQHAHPEGITFADDALRGDNGITGPTLSQFPPNCLCVVKDTGCLGREEYTRQFDGISTLQCGHQFERCCFEDPWPGIVDEYAGIAPCIPLEVCPRYYGQQATDVRDYGVLGPCPGLGTVRCLQEESFAIPIESGAYDKPKPPSPVYEYPQPPPPPVTTPLSGHDLPPAPVYEAPPATYEPPQTYEAPIPVLPPAPVYEAPPATYEPPQTYEAPIPVLPPAPVYEAPPATYEPPQTYEAPIPVLPPAPVYEAPPATYEPPQTYEAPIPVLPPTPVYEAPPATNEPPHTYEPPNTYEPPLRYYVPSTSYGVASNTRESLPSLENNAGPPYLQSGINRIGQHIQPHFGSRYPNTLQRFGNGQTYSRYNDLNNRYQYPQNRYNYNRFRSGIRST